MLFLLAPHAYGTALIIDSSTSEVKVSSSFIGTDVMVFGTANDKDDIIVVITGPTETAIVRVQLFNEQCENNTNQNFAR